MEKIINSIKKILIIALIFSMSIGIVGANPNQRLYVNAEEHGEFYEESVNKESTLEEKEVSEEQLAKPELKPVSKNNFENLLSDGYVEDLSQREESVKVFVKDDEEKRLYFMSPIHVWINEEWQDINTEQNYSRYLSDMTSSDIVSFSDKQFTEITPTEAGFIGSKTIDELDIVPFELAEGYSARLAESENFIQIVDDNNDVVHIISFSLKGEEFEGTVITTLLELHELDTQQYGISLSSENTFVGGRSFDIDLKSEKYKKYNNQEVSLYAVRSGAAYMNNSYNPHIDPSRDNAVIGNGDYNQGYIFCTGQYVCESRNNYGIISFYNQRDFKELIGKNRTVSKANLHLTYDTNGLALNGNGVKFRASMLDPKKNFDVENQANITYNNFQAYLDSSAERVPFGAEPIAWGEQGSLDFDITGIMQSWENSGKHHAIMIEGVSDGYGNYLETAHRVLNHVYSPDVSLRPYIEITTVKEEPIPDDYDINKTTLNLKPFTSNTRNLNVLQFTALGFDGLSKPGSSVKINVKDKNGTVVFTDNTYAFDGYRTYPQYTKELGYNLPDSTQTYYRLTSNYQAPKLLFNTGSNLKFNHPYKVTYQSSYGGTTAAEKKSDEFIIVKLTAYDRLPRLLAFYGVTDKIQFMQDNNMSDELLVEGNIVFIRNPKKNKDKVYHPVELSENDKRMIDNNLLGRNQHCVYGYEPINFNTGNFVYSNPDTGSIDYDKEILFERFYNSMGNGRIGLFGRNWNLEQYKELFFLANGSIEYSDGTGRILTFEKDGNSYKTPFDSNYKIEKYEISRKTIKVDSGYYDQDDKPRQKDKTIISYGYKILDSATSEEMIFNEVGNITSHTKSQYDLPMKYEYTDNELSAIITPAGRKFTFDINSMGLISQITDPSGNKLNYKYDDNLNLVEFSDQAGYVIKYSYDSEYRMLSYTGRETGDTVIKNVYDQKGKIIKQTDALNQTSHFEYFDDRTEVTNYKGDLTVVYTNAMGYTTRIVEESIDDCVKEYDANGN